MSIQIQIEAVTEIKSDSQAIININSEQKSSVSERVSETLDFCSELTWLIM